MMKRTFAESLINSAVTPSGQGLTIPINNGRFVLTDAYDIIDTQTNLRHVRDKSIPLSEAAFDITDLTAGNMSVLYLWAISVKPIKGVSDSTLRGKDNFTPVFKPGALDKAILDPKDFIWNMPVDGIPFSSGKVAIPGFSKYYVEASSGLIKHVSDDSSVIAGTNRGNVVTVIDDEGYYVDVEIGQLSLYATGVIYSITNLMPNVYYIDNDSNNLKLNNLSLKANVNTSSSRRVTDTAQDHIHGNDDADVLPKDQQQQQLLG